MAKNIWVLVEQDNGRPLNAVLELVSAARDFASNIDGFSYGDDVPATAETLGKYGLNRLFDLGSLGDSLSGPRVASAIAEVFKGQDSPPDAIFIPATYDGRDIAGRLSVKLDLPVITNVVNLTEDGEGFVSEHAIFGGKQIAKARFNGVGTAIFVIVPKSFEAVARFDTKAVVEPLSSPDTGTTDAAKIITRHVDERSGPSLDEAPVVVSGGRGLGERSNYDLVEQLAKLLKGAPGASRAIVDSGWVPYAYQVGMTGKTVKPEVYIACAISGETQHLVGMNRSKHIIAINKDQKAPIFSIADLGIVGDVNEILPRLVKALEDRG